MLPYPQIGIEIESSFSEAIAVDKALSSKTLSQLEDYFNIFTKTTESEISSIKKIVLVALFSPSSQ